MALAGALLLFRLLDFYCFVCSFLSRAFSVVETIESHYAIQSNVTPVPLSPQQFISCDSTSDGCKGGDIEKAMEWAESVLKSPTE